MLAGDIKKALTDLRNTVPPEERIFVRTKKDKEGRVIIDERMLSSRARDGHSGNLSRLADIASSSKTVELNTSSQSFSFASGGSSVLVNFGNLPQQLGITLPAGSMSIVPGVTQIFASPNIGAKMTAMVVAHELAHAWLFLGGRPYSHEALSGNRQDLRGYVNVFTKSAADEASRNYDPFYPYN
jgi:hypothetical protein